MRGNNRTSSCPMRGTRLRATTLRSGAGRKTQVANLRYRSNLRYRPRPHEERNTNYTRERMKQ